MTMAKHVDLLGWIFIVLGVLGVLSALAAFMIIAAGGLFSGDQEAIIVTTIVGAVIGGITVVFSIPAIIAGWGLLKRWNWARILALILGVLSLPGFPVGTALGIYALWVLLNERTTELFRV